MTVTMSILFLECDPMYSDRLSAKFHRNLLPLFPILKMETAGPSQILVVIYQTSQCHISEGSKMESWALPSVTYQNIC
jgi:hypothetical protein